MGRNEREHRRNRRDRGPDTRGKTRRDNVGKGAIPAGIGDNLQRPVDRGQKTEVDRRGSVWRMGP